MTRHILVATAALTLMAGAAFAQSTTSTTTIQSTVPTVVPMLPAPSTESTSDRTVDSNGVVTEHSKSTTSGTEVSPYGETTTTRRTTETTTVR
jgi:hypothetical protein